MSGHTYVARMWQRIASQTQVQNLIFAAPTRNMAEAVRNTYEAVPEPKLVVAVGACGVSGGLFAHSHAIVGPVDAVIPVDAYIPGCPPTPAMLVAGILQVLKTRIGRRDASGDVPLATEVLTTASRRPVAPFIPSPSQQT